MTSATFSKTVVDVLEVIGDFAMPSNPSQALKLNHSSVAMVHAPKPYGTPIYIGYTPPFGLYGTWACGIWWSESCTDLHLSV